MRNEKVDHCEHRKRSIAAVFCLHLVEKLGDDPAGQPPTQVYFWDVLICDSWSQIKEVLLGKSGQPAKDAAGTREALVLWRLALTWRRWSVLSPRELGPVSSGCSGFPHQARLFHSGCEGLKPSAGSADSYITEWEETLRSDLLFLGVKQTVENDLEVSFTRLKPCCEEFPAVWSRTNCPCCSVAAPLHIHMSQSSDFNSFMRCLNFITEPGSEIQESPRVIEPDQVVLMGLFPAHFSPLLPSERNKGIGLSWAQRCSSKKITHSTTLEF